MTLAQEAREKVTAEVVTSVPLSEDLASVWRKSFQDHRETSLPQTRGGRVHPGGSSSGLKTK